MDAQESSVFTVFVSANDNAPLGDQTFSVTIGSNEKILKQLPLTVNVQGENKAGSSQLKTGLEVGLVVLVILLVIIGLIIGFSKLRGDEDSEEEKTYY